MAGRNRKGWNELLHGYPWPSSEGHHRIPAYSEFMPPVRLSRGHYGDWDSFLFSEDDDYGWSISEVEEEYELRPGLANLANQIVSQIVELGEGRPAYKIAGHQKRNLENNPYWPPELADKAGGLSRERYVTLLPLSLSRTQDDKGRRRWTFFGGSEQGPERAIWESLYHARGQERPPREAFSFLLNLLSNAYGEACQDPSDLYRAGLRVLLTPPNPRFPYWTGTELPSSVRPFLLGENVPLDDVRYVLTFAPFSLLPVAVRERYLSGRLVLLPFPGSLVFWGTPAYARLQQELPMAMQLPLQRLAARHGGPEGIRVPQSGWFHEPGTASTLPEVDERLLANIYRRTSRWDRIERYEDEVILSNIEDTVGRTMFSTGLDVLGLYGKPMARNSQIWTAESHLLLNGPGATREDLERAAELVAKGGTFSYRFQFPPMQVGRHDIYWQRPLVAYRKAGNTETILAGGSEGYLTAYKSDAPDLAASIELWPRVQRREAYLMALRNFEYLKEHHRHQSALNIIRVLDLSRQWGKKQLPRSAARQVLTIPEDESLESWLAMLPERAENRDEGKALREELETRLEPPDGSSHASVPEIPRLHSVPRPLTYQTTATRDFEEAWWRDILTLSKGKYANRNNADCVEDPPTLARLAHRHRDVESLGNYLIGRHCDAIADAGMKGKALSGELRFRWETDFDFEGFGGWKNNQEGHTHERDIIIVIPGRNRGEAVIMADHYDTAYMEDVYNKSTGGDGARLASAGADDNSSATATLLQACPIFLKMSEQGLLERDVWLVHLTGEEFPSDCLGSRALCQAMMEGKIRVHFGNDEAADLSATRIVGVYVLDMVGHNRDRERDVFQIAPGAGRESLELAYQAHMANELWNAATEQWNQAPERRGKGRSQRGSDGEEIPEVARYPQLKGEIRLIQDPHSTLYNTDGQIFSDCGVPVVLFMEDYDIGRTGYHDTKDTIANIDLDYGSALAAIAIEAVARTATIS